ncbi:golgin subfamily A member 6-like protein 22 [Macrobrachium rosenbergii]|uniref:golgin subfamily A member 6-like protein 22 n=1 Tax=Macrobrachium rosenbergii TaxID=79674 RepID=UPI0034D777AF
MSDSEHDLGPDMSESEDDLDMVISDSEYDLGTDVSDSEDDFETDMSEDDFLTEMSLLSRPEDSLELESTEEEGEMEVMDQEIQLPRPRRDQPDAEKQRLEEALENSQAYGSKMEYLWKEAVKKIVWLQSQLDDKDILMKKNADVGAEMKKEIENVYLQKEQVLTEKLRVEEDLELAQDRGETTEKLNKELREKTASLQQAMVNKERELEFAIEKVTKLGLRLKETETFNQVLASEKEYFERLMGDYKDAFAKEERKVDSLQESLARKTIEFEKDQEKLRTLEGQMTAIEGVVADLESQTMDVKENQVALQGKLELAESDNSRLREVAADLRDGIHELEKNLTNEIQKNMILEDQVQSLETVLRQNEDRLVLATEILSAERAKAEIMRAELEATKNWVSQLGGQNAKINEKLEEKEAELTSVKKELENEKMKTQILEEEVQAMKNWVAELGGQNARHQEEVDENHQKITLLKKSLRQEKQRNRILQDALHHRKEVENLLEEEKERGNEMETSLRNLKVELDNRDLQIENFLNTERKLMCEKEELEQKLGVALDHGKELDREMESKLQNLSKERNSLLRAVEKQSTEHQLLIEEKEREKREMIMDYQETLKQKDTEMEELRKGEEELVQLRKECEKLKENWRIQEESMIKEQRRLGEHQRRLEEALKDQDKYMLMTLLHGTAQRNFHLQHIALQHGNEILDIDEKERQAEDLCMRKEKQYRKYCDTQRERTNYGKQWEVLTHTLTDLIHGDEKTPEVTNGDSNKSCEIFNENLVDKTCHQSNEDEM